MSQQNVFSAVLTPLGYLLVNSVCKALKRGFKKRVQQTLSSFLMLRYFIIFASAECEALMRFLICLSERCIFCEEENLFLSEQQGLIFEKFIFNFEAFHTHVVNLMLSSKCSFSVKLSEVNPK